MLHQVGVSFDLYYDARKHKIKSMIHAQFKDNRTSFTSNLDPYLRRNLLNITLREKKEYFERFEMRCWRRVKKIGWKDRVRDEEVLHIIKARWDIQRTIYKRKVDWIGHLLYRKCPLDTRH